MYMWVHVCDVCMCACVACMYTWYMYVCVVEPRNADTIGTHLKCPDYQDVLYPGVCVHVYGVCIYVHV